MVLVPDDLETQAVVVDAARMERNLARIAAAAADRRRRTRPHNTSSPIPCQNSGTTGTRRVQRPPVPLGSTHRDRNFIAPYVTDRNPPLRPTCTSVTGPYFLIASVGVSHSV